MAPLTREEIEQKRQEAMARGPAAPGGATRPAGAGQPNQSRLTLARAAIRPEMKGRVMLSGPAGAGKTYTALVIATTLVGPDGRILVIDTEKESSLTYADVFTFEHLRWNPPYDPTALSLTLKDAQGDYDCIITDSFSHFWRKQGGVLDIAGDNFRGWKQARPIQENLIETLLDVDCHVIVCCRSKMEHLLEEGTHGGKSSVTKVGIKAQQDDDLEYEVNVALEIDMPHVLHVAKSRTNAVPVGSQFLAGLAGDFAQQYREWLKSGEAVADKAATDALRAQINSIVDEGLRGRAQGLFLDQFGRPEFLLVSRLGEAQRWVADAVAGTLPVDRAEDAEPPETSHAGPGSDDDGTGGPGAQTRPAAAETATPSPSPDTGTQTGQTAGFDDDTGHCSKCGAPIFRDPEGLWEHADHDDDKICNPVPGEISPAADGVDVDALYAAFRSPPVEPDEAAVAAARRVVIEAEIGAMSHAAVARELGDKGLSTAGAPPALRARLLEWRLEAEAAPAT